MQQHSFFDRDLSWLAFNGRVLAEAADSAVPLLERIKLLSIYSSNLDEFYRVRMPLVAQFNLQQRFLQLVDREITHAQNGFPASITIKLNNLEERVLIEKLYEASRAGVQVRLIVRSICCLVPGLPGMSEHIVATRIVDRYLEHGQIFVFHNNGQTGAGQCAGCCHRSTIEQQTGARN